MIQAARDLVFGNIAQRRDVVNWSKRKTPDFDEVCDLCSLNPNETQDLISGLIYPEEAYDVHNRLVCTSSRKRQLFLYEEFITFVNRNTPDNII